MNRTLASALVVAAAAVAGSAFAETPTVLKEQFTGTATRAQVQADLAAYKQAGVNPWSTQYNPLKAFKGEKTRAQVTADYLAARDQVLAFTGEDSGSFALAQGRTSVVSPTLAGAPVNNAQ